MAFGATTELCVLHRPKDGKRYLVAANVGVPCAPLEFGL
jgi:hypothetical protein